MAYRTRLTIYVNDDVLDQLKFHAVKERSTTTEMLEPVILAWLKEQNAKSLGDLVPHSLKGIWEGGTNE